MNSSIRIPLKTGWRIYIILTPSRTPRKVANIDGECSIFVSTSTIYVITDAKIAKTTYETRRTIH